jgi:hypothetical protein
LPNLRNLSTIGLLRPDNEVSSIRHEISIHERYACAAFRIAWVVCLGRGLSTGH